MNVLERITSNREDAGMANHRDEVSVRFSELKELHRTHEERLEELRSKTWLTPEEEMEEKRLKKQKLRLKDQMEQLRRAAS